MYIFDRQYQVHKTKVTKLFASLSRNLKHCGTNRKTKKAQQLKFARWLLPQ